MEAEHKALLQKILSHQLEGLMLHFDLAAMYKLMKMPAMSRLHKRHFIEECENNVKTDLCIIDSYGEAMSHSSGTKISIARIAVPSSELEKAELHKRYLEKWLEWEQETCAIYEQAVSVMSGLKMWKSLHRDACREIKVVKKLLEMAE